jgi:hypothetical protein
VKKKKGNSIPRRIRREEMSELNKREIGFDKKRKQEKESDKEEMLCGKKLIVNTRQKRKT